MPSTDDLLLCACACGGSGFLGKTSYGHTHYIANSLPAQSSKQLLHRSSGVVHHAVCSQSLDQALRVMGAGNGHVGSPSLQKLNTHLIPTLKHNRRAKSVSRLLSFVRVSTRRFYHHTKCSLIHTWMANVPTPPDPPRIKILWRQDAQMHNVSVFFFFSLLSSTIIFSGLQSVDVPSPLGSTVLLSEPSGVHQRRPDCGGHIRDGRCLRMGH